jgi:hypothetical protein
MAKDAKTLPKTPALRISFRAQGAVLSFFGNNDLRAAAEDLFPGSDEVGLSGQHLDFLFVGEKNVHFSKGPPEGIRFIRNPIMDCIHGHERGMADLRENVFLGISFSAALAE